MTAGMAAFSSSTSSSQLSSKLSFQQHWHMFSSLLRAMTPCKHKRQEVEEQALVKEDDDNMPRPTMNADTTTATTSVADLWSTVDRELRLNIGNSLKCGICLSTLTNPVRTPCVHAFCKDCIAASLLSGNKKCPECNTSITKRSLQPFNYLQDLSDTYKTALREFGLVPTLYNPNFTTMTQKVKSNSQNDDDEDLTPQGQVDRWDVAATWQQKALPVLTTVPPIQKKENDQVVAANYNACKPFIVKKDLPTTQDVQEQAREQQWADDEWKQQQQQKDDDEEVLEESETSSKRVSFATKLLPPALKPLESAAINAGTTASESVTPRLTNVTIAVASPAINTPFDSAVSPIQVQHSQAASSLSMLSHGDNSPQEAGQLSMPTPSPHCSGPIQDVTGMVEDSFGALHLLPTSATKLHNDEDDYDDDRTQSMKSPNSSDSSSVSSQEEQIPRRLEPASSSSHEMDQKPAAASPVQEAEEVSVPDSDATLNQQRQWHVGDIVNVQARTWPGVNKPGGVARIANVEDGAYDVTYVLGGRESNVDSVFISSMASEEPKRRKQSSELPMALLQALEEQGFDTTGNRPLKTPYKKRGLKDTTNQQQHQQSKKQKISRKKTRPATVTPYRNSSSSQRLKTAPRSLSDYESNFAKADARYQQVLDTATAAKELHIVTSKLNPDDMAVLRELCSRPVGTVKFRLVESFGKKSTICILPVEEKDGDVRPKVRTVKAMRSALAGIPMVSPDWIHQVASQEQVAMPSIFVRSLPTRSVPITTGGVTRLAANAKGQLFKDKFVFLCGSFPDGQRTDMQVLAKEAGSKILKTLAQVGDHLKRFQSSSNLIVLCHNSIIAPASLEKQLRRSLEANPQSVLVVGSSWLFDSIACGEALPPQSFAPSPSSKQRKGTELWRLCCDAN